VNSQKQVLYGTLIAPLDLNGDITAKPKNHVALWAGEQPCDSNGNQIANLVNQQIKERIREKTEKKEELVAVFSFSQKPRPEGYLDYYEKMTTYIKMLEGHAHVIDSTATSQTWPVIIPEPGESVFCYMDNASSRAGILAISDKLKTGKIAIVGLGGTGAYVLDLVAKTPIEEIHLFDGDVFHQHNAFRSPGAPSVDDLRKKPTKVQWFADIYSRMRDKIFPHPQFVDEKNIADLKQMEFVFLCIEGRSKKLIVDYLIENKIPFIDVGIGMYVDGGALGGNARVTTCLPGLQDHITKWVGFGEALENEYSRDIQIADMNVLNAALAVIRWKKIRGFYVDLQCELNSTYGIGTNVLTNDELPNENKTNQT
jgi:molybdopterin/thiamine biosynthesis adenylyltransferase